MSADPFRYPQLRNPLDMRFERLEGKDVLLLRCPIGISNSPLLLVPEVAPLVASFDGRLSFEQIVAKFLPYGGTEGLIRELITLLDNNLFLQGPRFAAVEQKFRSDYRQKTQREAALAGLGYPADPKALQAELDAYLRLGSVKQRTRANEQMVALVSPHIDYRRGHVCYGQTYSQLKPGTADLYVLIGTSHQYSSLLFHLTKKDFLSPVGTLPCASNFVENLAKRYGYERSFADEILHKQEHSLELQVPFLRSVLGPVQIVPILMGGFHEYLRAQRFPNEFDEYESFAAALAELLKLERQQGRKICFIVGVDMAHVGRTFGDKGGLTPEFMQKIEERDRRYISAIANQDRQGFYQHVLEDQDARRICGFPSTYLVLDVVERLGIKYRADIFDYRQAVDYKTDCAVTFAGMGLYEPSAA